MPVYIQFQNIVPLKKKEIQQIRKLLNNALSILGIPGKKFTIFFTNNELIKEYNRRFLRRDYPTNVIAFPQAEEREYLGDIIVSLEKAREEAEIYDLEFFSYVIALCFHGLLHLLGYDHERGVYSPWLMLKNEIKLTRELLADERVIKYLMGREYMPAKLAVNVDHVATVREARRSYYPDPVHAAVLAELGGADGIVVHLRLDRRHIKERDVRIIKEIIKTKLILEMAIDEDLLKFAKEVKPYQVTLVPERVEEITTEGGLELEGRVEEVRKAVEELNRAGIKVSLFLNPDEKALELAKRTGAQIVELHTGIYAEARTEEEKIRELERLERSAYLAKELGFIVHAGHGLNYENIGPVASIPQIEEFSIGHAIVARAVMVGMKEAVREMKNLLLLARG